MCAAVASVALRANDVETKLVLVSYKPERLLKLGGKEREGEVDGRSPNTNRESVNVFYVERPRVQQHEIRQRARGYNMVSFCVEVYIRAEQCWTVGRDIHGTWYVVAYIENTVKGKNVNLFEMQEC